MTDSQIERYERAADFGRDVFIARKGRIAWAKIGDAFNLRPRDVKDCLNVYRFCFLDGGHLEDIPAKSGFDYSANSDDLPGAIRGTISETPKKGFYVCLSTREYYYERAGADSLSEAYEWYDEMMAAFVRKNISTLENSTLYFS